MRATSRSRLPRLRLDPMLLNLEYAHGDLNNSGIYLKFGFQG